MDDYQRRLRRAVYQAWDLKESPYYPDAIEAIVELHEHRLEIDAQQERDTVGAFHPFALACLLRSIYAPTPGSTRQEGER